MKKMVIGLTAIILILAAILFVLSGSGGYSSRDVLTAGSYIFGEDIKESSYMYQLTGPGEITISSSGEEVYYSDLAEGESVHEHYLPVANGDVIEITEGATLELI